MRAAQPDRLPGGAAGASLALHVGAGLWLALGGATPGGPPARDIPVEVAFLAELAVAGPSAPVEAVTADLAPPGLAPPGLAPLGQELPARDASPAAALPEPLAAAPSPTEAPPEPFPEPPPLLEARPIPQEPFMEPEALAEAPPEPAAPPPAARSVPPPAPRPPARRSVQAAPRGAPRGSAAEAVRPSAQGPAAIPVAAAALAPGPPPLLTQARYRHPPAPPAYPPRAIALRMAGTALIRALVGPDGQTRELRLHRSSGFAELDQAAMAAVRGWAFAAATEGGLPIETWVEVPVRFRLDD